MNTPDYSDYSAIDLRVAAALPDLTDLARTLADGGDPYTPLTREIYGPDATKADRRIIKHAVLRRLYSPNTQLADESGDHDS